MWISRQFISIFFFAAAFLFVSAPAFAQETVSVEVRSIAASSDGAGFDSRLNDLRARLQRGFAGYSSFQQLDNHQVTLRQGAANSLRLPTGGTLTLEYQGMAGDLVKLGLSIEGRLNTTLRATPGSTFFQAGLSYQSGILILAITVE